MSYLDYSKYENIQNAKQMAQKIFEKYGLAKDGKIINISISNPDDFCNEYSAIIEEFAISFFENIVNETIIDTCLENNDLSENNFEINFRLNYCTVVSQSSGKFQKELFTHKKIVQANILNFVRIDYRIYDFAEYLKFIHVIRDVYFRVYEKYLSENYEIYEIRKLPGSVDRDNMVQLSIEVSINIPIIKSGRHKSARMIKN